MDTTLPPGSLALVTLGGALAALAEQREGECAAQADRQPRELRGAHARVEEGHAEQDGHGLVDVAGDGHLELGLGLRVRVRVGAGVGVGVRVRVRDRVTAVADASM